MNDVALVKTLSTSVDELRSVFSHIEQDTSRALLVRSWLEHVPEGLSKEQVLWLECVGGVWLEGVHTEMELISAAKQAPDALTFGIAHGRLVDAMSFDVDENSPAYPIVMKNSKRSTYRRSVLLDVLNRGYTLYGQDEMDHPEYMDDLGMGYARDPRHEIEKRLISAPSLFMLGQLTSWYLVNLKCEDFKNGWVAPAPLGANVVLMTEKREQRAN